MAAPRLHRGDEANEVFEDEKMRGAGGRAAMATTAQRGHQQKSPVDVKILRTAWEEKMRFGNSEGGLQRVDSSMTISSGNLYGNDSFFGPPRRNSTAPSLASSGYATDDYSPTGNYPALRMRTGPSDEYVNAETFDALTSQPRNDLPFQEWPSRFQGPSSLNIEQNQWSKIQSPNSPEYVNNLDEDSFNSHKPEVDEKRKSVSFTEPLLQPPTHCPEENEIEYNEYETIENTNVHCTSHLAVTELIQIKNVGQQILWCETPQVINSQVLGTLNPRQKKLQEAKFEFIVSEAMHVSQLNVVEHHFMSSPKLNDDSILIWSDRRDLFGNIIEVKRCAEKFLFDLEQCWLDDILLHGICETINQHASHNFTVYVKHCSNQIYSDRTLHRLKEQNSRFVEVLKQLEASPKCKLLSLHSFLLLPMQRITRLRVLTETVLSYLEHDNTEYKSWEVALATFKKILEDCNEGARQMESIQEILTLSQQIEFPREMKCIPIISPSRYLVCSGKLKQLIWRGDETKSLFRLEKKYSTASLHVFLFTDLLIITKRKSEESYTVVDYCARNLVQISSGEGKIHLPEKYYGVNGHNLFVLTMLQNYEKKSVEMILFCPLESDKKKWVEAFGQPPSDNPDENVYGEWDCPQVVTVQQFVATQSDELSLEVSDVVDVLRKMSDGWYHGVRVRDGATGWFPANYTSEILSEHTRARNFKQRHNLLTISGNFLESQQKEINT